MALDPRLSNGMLVSLSANPKPRSKPGGTMDASSGQHRLEGACSLCRVRLDLPLWSCSGSSIGCSRAASSLTTSFSSPPIPPQEGQQSFSSQKPSEEGG